MPDYGRFKNLYGNNATKSITQRINSLLRIKMITTRDKFLFGYKPERVWTPKRTTDLAFYLIGSIAIFRAMSYAGLDMLAVAFMVLLSGSLIAWYA